MRLITLIILVSSWGIIGCEKKETVTVTEIVIQEPPEPISQPIIVNVNASVIEGDFLVDGQLAFNSPYVRAKYYIKQPDNEQVTLLGESDDQDFQVMVINGSYQVFYQHIQGTELAANVDDELPTTLSINSDMSQDIDIETYTVRGSFTLNGAPFPNSHYDKGVFYLEPTTGGDLIEFGHSNRSNDPVRVLSGTYHVVWDYQQGSIVPGNYLTRVMTDVAITANTGLNVDVVTTAMRFGATLNGAQFPDSPYENGDFYFTNDTGAEVFLGKTFEASGVINLIPGVYNLEYRFAQGGGVVPVNSKSVIIENHDVTQPLSVDIQTANLSLTPTLNNEAFAQSAYLDGVLELYDHQTNSYTFLGRTWNQIENIKVIRSVYAIAYSQEDGAEVPQNKRAIVEPNVDATSDINLELNITGYNVTGNITLDGESFPFNQYDAADIIMRGSNSTEDILLFSTYAQQEPVMILPGTYDVYYSCQTCTNIPFNTDALIIEDIEVSSDIELGLDLESARVEVSATLNGGAFPNSPYADGVIWGGLGNTDRIFMGRTSTSLADIIVLTGEYNFWYQVEDNSGNSVPINEWELVDQQVIGN